MGEIYCSECGEKLDDSASFCSKCGNAIENNSPKIVKSSKDNRKILIIGGLAIIGALLLVGIIFMAQGTSATTYEINGLEFNIPSTYDKYESSSQTNYGMYSETYTFSTSAGYGYDDIEITVSDIGDNDVSDVEDKFRNDWVWDEKEIGGKVGFGKLSGSTQYGFVYLENNKMVIIEVPMTPSTVDMSRDELIAYVIQ